MHRINCIKYNKSYNLHIIKCIEYNTYGIRMAIAVRCNLALTKNPKGGYRRVPKF
jgi:hypothetical protein